ncbi:uncharacterized protein MELLADRAFT_114527 [Melampsora larici-populina 98AG31]|uniref:Uncharacterized protein n=1 Tax=Melampsora larici-populina (strain 98AG31 / pathotype 3-4-7) TaxID=747676 RepID=F4SDU2_MELLP|nr:uncharacterized protein MELLADRAFT_114527 [Melampsora larici-populina 98AG31]EGF97185.1 hypothetical protein MELLADRAFT_114527 [Melampsora larici-populina 98AG31]
MQVDVNVYQTQRPHARPQIARPTTCSAGFYRQLCTSRTICYCCLKAYDETHCDANDRFVCPNPGATTADMDAFVAECRRNLGPGSPLVAAVSANPHPSGRLIPPHRCPSAAASRRIHTPALPLPQSHFGFDQAPAALQTNLLSEFPPLIDSVGQPPNPTTGVSALFHEFHNVEFPESLGQTEEFLSTQPIFGYLDNEIHAHVASLAFHGEKNADSRCIAACEFKRLILCEFKQQG